MKTVVTNLSLIAIMALASSALAEGRSQAYDLYANRDGRAFSFERSFPSLETCDAAARSLYESKRVRGAGCKQSTSTPAVEEPNSGAKPEEPKASTRER